MYIFILGLDHSRTTISDIVLGNKIGAISLGEVRRTISPMGKEADNIGLCSCGKEYEECEIWQKLLDGSLLTSKKVAVIDSSKDIRHYKKNFNKQDEVVTIFVLRKFRSWYSSVLKSRFRNKRHKFRSIWSDKIFLSSNLRLYLRRFWLFAYFEWLITHIRFLVAIEGKTFVISCSDDIDRVAKELGKFSDTGSRHIVRGNRVLKDKNVELKNFDERGLLQNFCKFYLEKKDG